MALPRKGTDAVYKPHLAQTTRWGDAPVRSLFVGMSVPREQIHYFAGESISFVTLRLCVEVTLLLTQLDIGYE